MAHPCGAVVLYLRTLPATSIVTTAKELSPRLRGKLLDHVAGPRPISVAQSDLRPLLLRGLLALDRPIGGRRSMLSALGRQVAIVLLAAEATTIAPEAAQ